MPVLPVVMAIALTTRQPERGVLPLYEGDTGWEAGEACFEDLMQKGSVKRWSQTVVTVVCTYSDSEQHVREDVEVPMGVDQPSDRVLAQSWSVFPLSRCQPASVRVLHHDHAPGGTGDWQVRKRSRPGGTDQQIISRTSASHRRSHCVIEHLLYHSVASQRYGNSNISFAICQELSTSMPIYRFVMRNIVYVNSRTDD
jgi:hypothetical protein